MNFPEEILENILQFLSDFELCQARLVCKNWSFQIRSTKLWKIRICQISNFAIVRKILQRNQFLELEKMSEFIVKIGKLQDPYLYSIKNDQSEFINFLWPLMDEPNPICERNLTCFHYCALTNSTLILDIFLEKMPNKNPTDSDLNTPLHLAAKKGHFECVKKWPFQILKANPKNQSGFTPLHYASENGHLVIVELFLQSDARKIAQYNA